MNKVFRVHTRFVPKSSDTSTYAFFTPGDYALETTQPTDGGLRVITKNRLVSVYVNEEEFKAYGSLVDSSFEPIDCHLFTVEEVAKLVEESPGGVSFSGESATQLAKWLKELYKARQAIVAARLGLAKANA